MLSIAAHSADADRRTRRLVRVFGDSAAARSSQTARHAMIMLQSRALLDAGASILPAKYGLRTGRASSECRAIRRYSRAYVCHAAAARQTRDDSPMLDDSDGRRPRRIASMPLYRGYIARLTFNKHCTALGRLVGTSQRTGCFCFFDAMVDARIYVFPSSRFLAECSGGAPRLPGDAAIDAMPRWLIMCSLQIRE